jgi:hypothetical protein
MHIRHFNIKEGKIRNLEKAHHLENILLKKFGSWQAGQE